jgi:hypothetical protein
MLVVRACGDGSVGSARPYFVIDQLVGQHSHLHEVLRPRHCVCDAGAFWGAQRARAERDAARQALTAHQARLERIVDAAHEYADDNDLCSRFDDFMDGQGLRPRSRDWVCEVDATVRVRVTVSARNADAAAGEVDDYAIADAIQEMNRSLLHQAIQDRDVVDTEEA